MTRALELEAETYAVLAACAAVDLLPCATQAEIDGLVGGLKEIKARLKFLEADRKTRTAPALAEVESIRAEYRGPEGAYAALETATKARVLRAQNEQRALEQAARAAAQAVQLEAHAAAQAGDAPTAIALQQTAFEAMGAAPEALKSSGFSTRAEWRVRVVAPALVPRALCVPDEARILADVRANLPKAEPGKAVPGLASAAWAALGVEVYLHEIAVVR